MDISPDILIYRLLPLLSLREIRQLCQIHPNVRTICQDGQLWQALLRRDFVDAGLKPRYLSPFEFYAQLHKCRQLISEKYSEAPQKPNDMTYSEYYELLEMSKIIKLTKHKTRRIIEQVGNIYIIPDIITIRGLLEQVGEKAGILGHYIVTFSIEQKDDTRGLIVAEMIKYNEKYYMETFSDLLGHVNNPSLKIDVAETHYPQGDGYEMKEEFLDTIILNTIIM